MFVLFFLQLHSEYLENIRLRVENKLLKSMKFQKHYCECNCNSCDEHALKMMQLEDHQVIMENKRLKKEYADLVFTMQKSHFWCSSKG